MRSRRFFKNRIIKSRILKNILVLCAVTALAAAPSIRAYASTYGPKYNVQTTTTVDKEAGTITVVMTGHTDTGDAPTKGYWYALLNGETIAENNVYETDNANRQRSIWQATFSTDPYTATVTSPIFADSCTYSILETYYDFTLTIVMTNPSTELTGIGLKLSGMVENNYKMSDAKRKYSHVETGTGGYSLDAELEELYAAEEPQDPEDPEDPEDPDPETPAEGEVIITVNLPEDDYGEIYGSPTFRFVIANEEDFKIYTSFTFDGDEDLSEGYYKLTKTVPVSGTDFNIRQLNMSRYVGTTSDEENFTIVDGDSIEITYEEQLSDCRKLSYTYTMGEL